MGDSPGGWGDLLGGVLEKGLNRWIDVETFNSTNGQMVPQWQGNIQAPTIPMRPTTPQAQQGAGVAGLMAGNGTMIALGLGVLVVVVLLARGRG